MLRTLSIAAGLAAILTTAVALPAAATTQDAPKDVHWSFEGPLGMYDQAQLQRGYKVYREVCSSCHSMNLVAFRNLGDKGGPFWNPKYPNPNDNPVVKAIAADYQIADIDSDTGETVKRPGTSADYFPNPYANPTAGKAANGGALPPDMSLLAAAREGGPAYIYSIVMGDDATIPAGLTLPPGKHYDPYIAGDLTPYWHGDANKVPRGGLIAMPPPLSPGKVQFDDGTKSGLSQEAWDVAAFLQWAADPKMEQRKQLGVSVMIFLVLFSGLLWVAYRNLWRDIEH
jgi:ubiquinol-cytochrome c reductase cytochrome c1 subunit